MEQQAHLVPGANVYGSDGSKVGTISTWGKNFIVVAKGFFFPTDYYIPMSAVESYTNEEVFLTVSKDEALNQGWDIEPVEDMSEAPDLDTQNRGYNTGPFQQNKFELDPSQTGAYQTDSPGTMASQEGGGIIDSHQGDASSGAELRDDQRDDSTVRVPVQQEQVNASKRIAEYKEHVSETVLRDAVDVEDSTVHAKSEESTNR